MPNLPNPQPDPFPAEPTWNTCLGCGQLFPGPLGEIRCRDCTSDAPQHPAPACPPSERRWGAGRLRAIADGAASLLRRITPRHAATAVVQCPGCRRQVALRDWLPAGNRCVGCTIRASAQEWGWPR